MSILSSPQPAPTRLGLTPEPFILRSPHGEGAGFAMLETIIIVL